MAVLAPHIDDTEGQVCILTDIGSMPAEIMNYIQNRVPTYKLKFSKTVGHKYFANTRPKCGMLSGNFYLHSEPGAPFFPTDEKEAKLLYMTKIPINGPVNIEASLHVGTGELISKNVKEIA